MRAVQALRFNRLGAVAVATLALAAGWGGVARAAYPDHTITAIIPFSPGGQSDVQGRIIAGALSQELGQTILVENKPGAGGNIGIKQAQDAKPDGYTILISSIALTVNPALYKNLGWDPAKLQPVAVMGNVPAVVDVNPKKFPTGNLQDFVKLLKSEPGKWNFAGADSGINEQLFALAAGVQIQTVNYGGAGETVTAIMNGEADAGTTTVLGVIPFVGPKLRVLAVSGNKRSSALPDVPSAAEAGVPDYKVSSYIMMVTQKGVPADIVQRLNDAANKVVQNPDIIDKFKKVATDLRTSTVKETEDFFKADIAQYQDVITRGHIPTVDQ